MHNVSTIAGRIIIFSLYCCFCPIDLHVTVYIYIYIYYMHNDNTDGYCVVKAYNCVNVCIRARRVDLIKRKHNNVCRRVTQFQF